jgi:uncharacterized membrane protein YjgN (DUF898 family)
MEVNACINAELIKQLFFCFQKQEVDQVISNRIMEGYDERWISMEALVNEGSNLAYQAHVKQESRFEGGLLSLIGWSILGFLVTVFTLGICYPWSLVMLYRWRIEHTVIDGRRLKFHGTAIGLFGNWIKWWLLCIITIGIYSFWLGIKLEQWRVKHTHFA